MLGQSLFCQSMWMSCFCVLGSKHASSIDTIHVTFCCWDIALIFNKTRDTPSVLVSSCVGDEVSVCSRNTILRSDNDVFFVFPVTKTCLYWKAWHKKFFILKETPVGPELSMFSSQQEAKTGTIASSFTILIRESVHLGITSESHRFSHVLVVVVSGRSPLLLAADDDLTARYVD